MTSSDYPKPGRLGDPSMEMKDDPRADPRMLAALAPLGMDGRPPEVPANAQSELEDLRVFSKFAEPEYEKFFGALGDVPPVEGVVAETVLIDGADGNQISLLIHRPEKTEGPLPAVVHFHGGGMVFMKAASDQYTRWRDELAARGMVAIGVDFRNAGGELGDHPFPAGLNDCASATQWTAANKEALGISHLILSGESGGGNLSIATALKAKKDGWLDSISGVFAMCPYISGSYAAPPASLPSLVENDGYMLDVSMMSGMVKLYDPEGDNAQNPLAWPMHADAETCSGLPPHVISLNELDPLRDEGMRYFHTLLAAGVDATSRTINGTGHAADCIFLNALPEVCGETLDAIRRFADRVG